MKHYLTSHISLLTFQFFLFLPLIFFSIFAKAQSSGDSLKQFTVDSNIIQDKRVNELVLKHILINESKKGKMKGYRVQIHFGTEKAKAIDVKSKFMTQYNNVPSYLDYHQPYFKIRVGDFRTKSEAYKLLQEISGDFTGAFIVSDDIELPPL
ncbi:MAG: SPOR domain-containing protein [Bacteroidota bacterium]